MALAKSKIARFRRSSTPAREDLPPPYSENPPANPFYQDSAMDSADLELRQPEDSRPLVVSPPSLPHTTDPLYQQHLYPLLHPIAPPYHAPDPPPFALHASPPHALPSVTPSRPFLRRESSCLSDGEAAEAVAGLAALHLRPQHPQHPR